jgi:hypothetical protein
LERPVNALDGVNLKVNSGDFLAVARALTLVFGVGVSAIFTLPSLACFKA